MAETRQPILIGCSGWSYPDWEGPFYPEGMAASDYLEWYADRFPIVEVDSTFYRPPAPSLARGWMKRTPPGFQFALKVPRVITHEKQLKDCAAEVEGFVGSLAPLGPKAVCGVLQLGYFNQGAFHGLDDFLSVLDDFLRGWPSARLPLAVEIRNPRWMVAEFADVLRRHGAALTLTVQQWMPKPARIAQSFDPITGPFAFVRLLGDRDAIEKITTRWDRLVVDRAADLEETGQVIETLARRVPVYVFANNHYAGFSPETVRQLRNRLNLPEPTPPQRPRTTLFD